MSIQSEINRIATAVEAAHEKVAEKGGITARPYLVDNLAAAIDTIPVVTDTTKVSHGEHLLSEIVDAYILNIDYSQLAFDTTEIVGGGAINTSPVLGQAILGQMVLA